MNATFWQDANWEIFDSSKDNVKVDTAGPGLGAMVCFCEYSDEPSPSAA
jgi:hypothetical protein